MLLRWFCQADSIGCAKEAAAALAYSQKVAIALLAHVIFDVGSCLTQRRIYIICSLLRDSLLQLQRYNNM